MELVNVQFLGKGVDYQTYKAEDSRLITTNTIAGNFRQSTDYVEYTIYDVNNNTLAVNYGSTNYKIPEGSVDSQNGLINSIIIDPEGDIRANGITRGSAIIEYNFFRRLLNTSQGVGFWIKEISPSRTEIKVTRLDQANEDLRISFSQFNAELGANGYYPDFYLKFDNNVELIAVNALFVEEDSVGYILFKLYEPLPRDFNIKSTFWVVSKVSDSIRYQVTIEVEAVEVVQQAQLRGPNFNIAVNQKVGQTTPYYNYDSLFSTTVTSSYQQLQSLLDEKAVRINVDYSNFSNFIHFSSATERIQNFVYKVRLIEQYNASITQLNTVTGGSTNVAMANSAKATLQQNIDNLIKKFDGYEYYLYYTSASTAWPKSTSNQPYTLYSVTSSQVSDWLGSESTTPTDTNLSILYSASLYDNLNSDCLRYTTPTYIREDSENQPYLTFLDMIGQHFDNIWIYYKDVTNRFSAENNPNVGISIDLVGDALKALGVQLYTNTNLSDSIYYSLLGINPNGSLLPPTGSELITTYVTSSIETLPALTLEEEIYKRLYHNLPYLLKTKGTERGVRALIACYGIPNSILTVNEFGGYNMFTQPDILGIQDNKIYTGSVEELQDKVLSPYTTIQVYNNNTEVNSSDIEIGFSPADSINADITGSIPGIDIMQLVGSPSQQYTDSYEALAQVREAYFKANYTSRYNVWDFIRIIKYYNNSLFKMLKDFVPARASLASSIIIKPHMLERNKYARHEPTATTSSIGFDQEGIEMVRVSGSDPDEIKYSTAYVGKTIYLSGSVPIQNIYSFEKYTGEFSGSTIQAADNYFDQKEYSYQPYQTTLGVQEIVLNPTINNVSASTKSTRFFDLDYSSNQGTPVNYGLITKSINAGQSALSDPYAPYAQLQDYNYYLRRSIIPRYSGSYLSGRYYNTHSVGDISYGGDPVINWNAGKLGLFTQIYTSSFIPGLVNISLAYLADVSGGLGELNQENRNWQEVQNTFKGGTTLTIKQFDNRKYSAQQTTDGIKRIYSSGYAYSPIIYFSDCAIDGTASFENLQGNNPQFSATANNDLFPDNYITGVPSPTYPLFTTSSTYSTISSPRTVRLVGNLYDNIIDGEVNFTTGSLTTPPKFKVNEEGDYNISNKTSIAVEVETIPQTFMSWSFQIVKKATSGVETILKEIVTPVTIGTPSSVQISMVRYCLPSTGFGRFTIQLTAPLTQTIYIDPSNIGVNLTGPATGINNTPFEKTDDPPSTPILSIDAGSTSLNIRGQRRWPQYDGTTTPPTAGATNYKFTGAVKYGLSQTGPFTNGTLLVGPTALTENTDRTTQRDYDTCSTGGSGVPGGPD